jgi:hypothetical protein
MNSPINLIETFFSTSGAKLTPIELDLFKTKSHTIDYEVITPGDHMIGRETQSNSARTIDHETSSRSLPLLFERDDRQQFVDWQEIDPSVLYPEDLL